MVVIRTLLTLSVKSVLSLLFAYVGVQIGNQGKCCWGALIKYLIVVKRILGNDKGKEGMFLDFQYP